MFEIESIIYILKKPNSVSSLLNKVNITGIDRYNDGKLLRCNRGYINYQTKLMNHCDAYAREKNTWLLIMISRKLSKDESNT